MIRMAEVIRYPLFAGRTWRPLETHHARAIQVIGVHLSLLSLRPPPVGPPSSQYEKMESLVSIVRVLGLYTITGLSGGPWTSALGDTRPLYYR